MAGWYYAKDGQQEGPVSAAELKQLASSGKLEPDDLVFQEGGKEWVAASTIKGLFPAGGAVKAKPEPAPAKASSKASKNDFDMDGGDEDDAPAIKKRGGAAVKTGGGGGFGDVLGFRKLIAPTVIVILFWLGVVGACLGGLGMAGMGAMTMGQPNMGTIGLMIIVSGLLLVPFGILAIRLVSEVQIVVFRIYETLNEIKVALQEQKKS